MLMTAHPEGGTTVKMTETLDGVFAPLNFNPLVHVTTVARNAESLMRLEELALLRGDTAEASSAASAPSRSGSTPRRSGRPSRGSRGTSRPTIDLVPYVGANGPSRELADLMRGEGDIVRHEGEKVAGHRDEAGELHAVSTRCTHLGCQVSWNAAERSWDCACHGSRFAPDGAVLHGPAVRGLERTPVRDASSARD